MDNITKKPFLEKCSQIANVILFVLPILTDLLGLISFFTPNLQTFINNTFGVIPCITIIATLNIVLIANIFFVLEKYISKKTNKTTNFFEGYKNLLETYTSYLTDFETVCEKITSVEELYSETSDCLKTLVDKIKEILNDVTGEKIRVCIKAFPEKYEHHDVNQMELMTFCRSDTDLKRSKMEQKDRIKVHENTDFKLIMLNTYPYFAFNDLKNFKNETKTDYENSSSDWEKKYNATIVYPISKCVGVKDGKNLYHILGFICVDSLSTNAFSVDIGPMCIKFIASLSFMLYIFLDKCITYRETLENNKEGMCVTK